MAAEWTVAEFDPRSPAFAADPYPFYERLRRDDPVHFIPPMNAWWVTRYADVVTVLKDGRFGKEPASDAPPPSLPPAYARVLELPQSMFMRDPPDHTRLRSLVSKAFTPRVLEQLRPQIEEIAAELLIAVEHRTRMDMVMDFAFPLPATVIARMLGVPEADRERFKEWSNRIMLSLDGTQPQEVLERGFASNLELVDYFDALIARRRGHPTKDLIGQLIVAEEQGDRLSTGEVLTTCVLLLVAGHETTTNLIGTGILTLLRHPDQMQMLRARSEVLPTAIEELLRYESPAQRMARIARQDLELGGKSLRRGDHVVAIIGAANRDPEVFADPEALDISRRDNPHLAFGRGIHFCLGASLAVLEAEIAFAALLHRIPRLELEDPGPQWSSNTRIRGLRSLPVRF